MGRLRESVNQLEENGGKVDSLFTLIYTKIYKAMFVFKKAMHLERKVSFPRSLDY